MLSLKLREFKILGKCVIYLIKNNWEGGNPKTHNQVFSKKGTISILDSQPERLLSFYNCHDLLAKVLHNCPCLHISLLVSMTSHFSIFPPSSLFLITMSPIVHLADSTYSMRTPSFCFCDHLFSSFLTHWNKRRCQNVSKEMAQCTRCATPPPPLG